MTRVLYLSALLAVAACGGARPSSPTPPESTAPAKSAAPAESAAPAKPAAPAESAAPEAAPAEDQYCTADGLCYEGMNRGDYESDDALMCDAYCTDYCACYEETEGEECEYGSQCVDSCTGALADPARRADQIETLKCAQTAECKQLLEEC